MTINHKNFIYPKYKTVKLHSNCFNFSFENLFNIKKAYKEIIGLNDIDHISINIVNPNNEMTIISLNPAIAHSIISDGSYIYNGSISPDFYMNKDFYTWEEAYDPNFKLIVKGKMQIATGISEGCVLTKKINGFHVLFSFACKNKKVEFKNHIEDNKQLFYKMGEHCLEQIKPIYNSYAKDESEIILTRPNLKLVANKNGE